MSISSTLAQTAHPLVGSAVDIIRSRNQCDTPTALEILRVTAQRHKLDLVELAREVVIVGGMQNGLNGHNGTAR